MQNVKIAQQHVTNTKKVGFNNLIEIFSLNILLFNEYSIAFIPFNHATPLLIASFFLVLILYKFLFAFHIESQSKSKLLITELF